MTNSTDVSDMKMTRFGYRVDLIRDRHVKVKDEAKIASIGSGVATGGARGARAPQPRPGPPMRFMQIRRLFFGGDRCLTES